jgi:hypothetical protein
MILYMCPHTGTLHERDTRELLEKCHPLGLLLSLLSLSLSITNALTYADVYVF